MTLKTVRKKMIHKKTKCKERTNHQKKLKFIKYKINSKNKANSRFFMMIRNSENYTLIIQTVIKEEKNQKEKFFKINNKKIKKVNLHRMK